jgi:heat shock protein 4
MDVGLSYHSMDGIMKGLPQLLARYRIEPPKPKEEKFSLKLRVQLDGNGIPTLDTAEQVEEYIEIKKIPIKKHQQDAKKPAENKDDAKDGEAAEGDKPAEDAKNDAPKEPEYEYEEKEVKKTRSTNIQFKWEQHGYGGQTITEFVKAEDEMCKQDNIILDVKIMRNTLETYVYDMRAAIDTIGNFSEYIKDDVKQTYLEDLNKTEEWIYDEGESAAKDVYQKKLDELKKIGDPVKARHMFHDVFPSRSKDFEDIVTNIYQQAVEIPDDSHITKEEKEELLKKCQDTVDWFNKAKTAQASVPKNEDPVIDLHELENRKNEVISLGTKILSKPAPKKDAKKDEKPEDKKEEQPQQDAAPDSAEGDNKDSEMKDN